MFWRHNKCLFRRKFGAGTKDYASLVRFRFMGNYNVCEILHVEVFTHENVHVIEQVSQSTRYFIRRNAENKIKESEYHIFVNDFHENYKNYRNFFTFRFLGYVDTTCF